ncbi:MAG: ABC transporter substrate-binding protein [Betaproteobacteria bacterium HGW-Betaproteobacteria-9]|jgi:tripartite-type tricarboxylate transporter receptor subunit TctC|nr:tripartite tricarboxylate transporter substrate binding protein [Hydrogenophaga sp.]PKO26499.1 MAG: ABC transporter substrate-binding protein [Betaproteobacteria bacterium HGW-Betaproteobacteria-9]
MKRRSLLQTSLALAATVVGAPATLAQTAPSGRPITIYVPYPAGGVSDAQSRTVAPLLSKALGQTVVVENLTGASGSIAAQKMLSSPADGHSLMVVSPSETILAPLIIAGLKYKAEDFRLLAAGIVAPTVLIARPTLEANNVNELVAYAISKTNKELSYGSFGLGSMPHLTAEDFRQRTGARLFQVPYRGGAPMLQDLMAGQIDVAFMPFVGGILGMVASGKLKVIGLATPTRLPALAQYPVLNDHPALKDFNYPVWSTFAVSKAVPDETAARLNKTLNEIMQLPEVQVWGKAAGFSVPESASLKGVADFYQAETAKIRALAKSVNLQAQ